MLRPNFFIVGAPKSGTTAMYQYLGQHPEIFVSPKKEPHFFARDLRSARFIRDEREYLQLFSEARTEQMRGEGSTNYLYSSTAAEEIHEFMPSARIIVMLRNPVDMIYSYHSQLLYGGHEDIVDFRAALEAENLRKQGKCLPKYPDPVKTLFYLEVGKYKRQLQRYFEAFGKENVHVIIFDDFKSDTLHVYRDTCTFLGVNTGFVPEFHVVNPNKIILSRTLRDFLVRPSPTARNIVKSIVPFNMRRWLALGMARFNTVHRPRAEMALALRRSLMSEFASDIQDLSRLLNRDLREWCK